MARVDLSVHEMALLSTSVELHAEQLAHGDDLTLVLELSHLHVKLLTACKEELELDRRARLEEHRV